jgi:putative acyl-CoA dehydrogenase
MRNVLADLALESEAATALMLRLAGSIDRSSDEREAAFGRIGVALGKYWICKRGPSHTGEALECLGGNGYVEESIMPRLYREAPVNSIWEGSGNVNALDLLRALASRPAALDAYLAEIALARGADARLDRAASEVRDAFAVDGETREGQARRIVERMALVLQGSLLVRHAPPAVADAFCAARLGGEGGHAFGTLPSGVDTRTIVDRAWPA